MKRCQAVRGKSKGAGCKDKGVNKLIGAAVMLCCGLKNKG